MPALTSLSCALNSGEDGKFMLCVFYHKKRRQMQSCRAPRPRAHACPMKSSVSCALPQGRAASRFHLSAAVGLPAPVVIHRAMTCSCDEGLRGQWAGTGAEVRGSATGNLGVLVPTLLPCGADGEPPGRSGLLAPRVQQGQQGQPTSTTAQAGRPSCCWHFPLCAL